MREEGNKERIEELKDAPGLRGISGREPFEAPDGYFDNFSSILKDRINAEVKVSASERLIQFIRKPAIIIPAFAIIVVGIIWFTRSETIDSNNQQLVALNYEDIYNSGLINDFDESMISEFIDMPESNYESFKEEEALLESISEETLINEL